jgi:transposase
METRKTYTKEFKLEVLQLVESSGKRPRTIEREMDLSPGMINKWRKELAQKEKDAFPGKGRLNETHERLRQLERENAILREERDILKKALAVVSKKP